MFDIDGTLLTSGGAGMRAFYRGFRQAFGISVDSEVVRPDGKTDPLIAQQLLAHFGRSDCWNEQSRDRLFASYLLCLEEEMTRAAQSGLIRILPGVTRLLEELRPLPEFALGLVTGNLEAAARIKLSQAGLEGYFSFGGYGSDSEDRTTLIRTAMRRGEELIAPARVEEAIVIGDTPLDILHGHAAGARVIAVATGRYSLAELQAHNPDLAIPNLLCLGTDDDKLSV